MLDPRLSELIEGARVNRQLPHAAFQYVDVTFTAANTDVVIPHTLYVDLPTDIRWTDVTPSAVYTGGSDTFPVVYASGAPDRVPWSKRHIVLRSTVAGYTTRLMLFTELVR